MRRLQIPIVLCASAVAVCWAGGSASAQQSLNKGELRKAERKCKLGRKVTDFNACGAAGEHHLMLPGKSSGDKALGYLRYACVEGKVGRACKVLAVAYYNGRRDQRIPKDLDQAKRYAVWSCEAGYVIGCGIAESWGAAPKSNSDGALAAFLQLVQVKNTRELQRECVAVGGAYYKPKARCLVKHYFRTGLGSETIASLSPAKELSAQFSISPLDATADVETLGGREAILMATKSIMSRLGGKAPKVVGDSKLVFAQPFPATLEFKSYGLSTLALTLGAGTRPVGGDTQALPGDQVIASWAQDHLNATDSAAAVALLRLGCRWKHGSACLALGDQLGEGAGSAEAYLEGCVASMDDACAKLKARLAAKGDGETALRTTACGRGLSWACKEERSDPPPTSSEVAKPTPQSSQRGSPLPMPQSPAPRDDEPTTGSARVWAIAGLVVVGLAVGGYFAYDHFASGSEDATIPETSLGNYPIPLVTF